MGPIVTGLVYSVVVEMAECDAFDNRRAGYRSDMGLKYYLLVENIAVYR